MSRASVNAHIRMEKKNCDLIDFVGETADLMGFSRTAVSRVYTEQKGKQKISSERQFRLRKHLINDRGQKPD